MAKLWDRLRRRLGGGDEHQSDPVHVRTEIAERPAYPDRSDTPASPSYVEQEISARNQYATHAITAPRPPEPPVSEPPGIVPQWWTLPAAELEQRTHNERQPQDEPQPHTSQSQPPDKPDRTAARTQASGQMPQPSALSHGEAGPPVAGPSDTSAPANGAHPIVLPPELLPLAPAAAPSAPSTLAAPEGNDLEGVFDGADAAGDPEAPWDETLAELKDFSVVDDAPSEASSEHVTYAGSGARPEGDDAPAGGYEVADVDDDDDREHNATAARASDIALHGANPQTRRRRGQRTEPGELDGQPARMVLPGRPLKRNEVPTLDTPLLVWSHDPSGEVTVRPELYACVETQWYGSSLYFLVIPWAERDAPDRSARLVVDATQLRVAPVDMAR